MTNTNTKFTKAMNFAKLVEIINASNETTAEKDRLIKFCMHETELIAKKKECSDIFCLLFIIPLQYQTYNR